MNGRDDKHRSRSLALSSQAGEGAGAEASDLYGDYENKLASDLTQLLKTAPVRSDRGGGDGQLPAQGHLQHGHQVEHGDQGDAAEAGGLGSSSRRERGGDGGHVAPAFVAAAKPYNDFVDDGSRPPIPAGWREAPEPEPSWAARQIRSGAAGFLAGSIIVVPAVLLLTGRLGDIVTPLTGNRPALEAAALQPALTPTTARPSADPVAAPAAPAASSAVAALPGPLETQAEKPAVAVAEPTISKDASPPEPPAASPAAPVAGAPPSAVPAAGTPSAAEPAATTREAAPPPPPLVTLTERAPDRPPPDPIAELMSTGTRLIGNGDIAGARDAFSRAASTGDPAATMALAETFDPNMLAAWGARDIKAEVGTARMLYNKALEAGIVKARARLQALD